MVLLDCFLAMELYRHLSKHNHYYSEPNECCLQQRIWLAALADLRLSVLLLLAEFPLHLQQSKLQRLLSYLVELELDNQIHFEHLLSRALLWLEQLCCRKTKALVVIRSPTGLFFLKEEWSLPCS